MEKLTISFVETENGTALIEKTLGDKAHLKFYKETVAKRLDDLADTEILSTFIDSRVGEEEFRRMPKLKLLATRSTGYDHIDVKAAERHGVTVANIPTYGENTVAEHTFALILSLSRNIHKAYVRTLQGKFAIEGLQGFDLKGKTLGVVGTGHIGLHVVRMARGFGMRVLAFDIQRNAFLADVLGFDYVDFDELISQSDIISLHAPHNPKTHHMINKETLSRCKKGALLINTSRGGLIDSNALVWALDQKILGGAGLDVLEGEDLIKEEAEILTDAYSKEALAILVRSNMLLKRDDVVITPHIAFNSREAFRRIIETTVSNIESFIEGRPENVITAPSVPPGTKAA